MGVWEGRELRAGVVGEALGRGVRGGELQSLREGGMKKYGKGWN